MFRVAADTTTFTNYYDETQSFLKTVSGMDPLLEREQGWSGQSFLSVGGRGPGLGTVLEVGSSKGTNTVLFVCIHAVHEVLRC